MIHYVSKYIIHGRFWEIPHPSKGRPGWVVFKNARPLSTLPAKKLYLEMAMLARTDGAMKTVR